jgi:hypothetical protein
MRNWTFVGISGLNQIFLCHYAQQNLLELAIHFNTSHPALKLVVKYITGKEIMICTW